MAIALTIRGKNKGIETELVRGFMQDLIVIGRAHQCDVCLPDMAVSTRHTEIRLEGVDYKIIDTGSVNGTWVNGKKLVAHRTKTLKNEDVITIAGFTIIFNLGVTAGIGFSKNQSMIHARQILSAILAQRVTDTTAPALLVLSGPSKAARYELTGNKKIFTIGRGRKVEINLDDKDVSREHAEVDFSDKEIVVRDLGSKNGVIVDGEKITEQVLQAGMVFVVGNTSIALEHPMDSALNAIQKAPEAETFTFSPAAFSDNGDAQSNQPHFENVSTEKTEPPNVSHDIAAEAEIGKTTKNSADHLDMETKEKLPPVPIGPADPMVDPLMVQITKSKPGFTQEIRGPEIEEASESDLGLIIVGSIIVVAAVIGLLLLLT